MPRINRFGQLTDQLGFLFRQRLDRATLFYQVETVMQSALSPDTTHDQRTAATYLLLAEVIPHDDHHSHSYVAWLSTHCSDGRARVVIRDKEDSFVFDPATLTFVQWDIETFGGDARPADYTEAFCFVCAQLPPGIVLMLNNNGHPLGVTLLNRVESAKPSMLVIDDEHPEGVLSFPYAHNVGEDMDRYVQAMTAAVGAGDVEAYRYEFKTLPAEWRKSEVELTLTTVNPLRKYPQWARSGMQSERNIPQLVLRTANKYLPFRGGELMQPAALFQMELIDDLPWYA